MIKIRLMKRCVCFVVMGLAVFAASAFAMSCGADMSHEGHDKAVQAESTAIDAGNKICPVTGEQIDEANKVTFEHEGKIYNFCCSGCIEPFKKDPNRYIEKVNQELKANEAKDID